MNELPQQGPVVRRPPRPKSNEQEIHRRSDPATFEPPKENIAVESARNLGEWAAMIAIVVVISILVRVFLFQMFFIPTGSMIPTLNIDDRIVVNKLAYKFGDLHRGDVVVFRSPPAELALEPEHKILVKRVIGLPGDVMEARAGVLYRNGELLPEPYLPQAVITIQLPKTTVAKGQVFMMGDNRTDSTDSRMFGSIDDDLVIGKVIVKVWPLNDLKLL